MLLLFNSMLSPGSSTEKVIIKCSVKLYVCKEKLVIGNYLGIFYFHSRGLLKPWSLLLISIPLRTTFLQMITLYTWLLIPGFDPFMLTVLKKKRPGELSVSMMDSKSRGPHSRPGQIILLISWARHFTLTVPISTHKYIIRYQWFEAWQNLCGGRGGYLSWTNYHLKKKKFSQIHLSCWSDNFIRAAVCC